MPMLRPVPLPRTSIDKSWSLDSLDGLEELTGLTARLLLDTDGRYAPDRPFANGYDSGYTYTPPPSPPPTRWPSPTEPTRPILPSNPLVRSPSTSPRASTLFAERHRAPADPNTPRPPTRLLPPPGLRRCVSDAPLSQSEQAEAVTVTSAQSSPGLALHLRKRAWTATPSPPARPHLPLPSVDDRNGQTASAPGTSLPPRKRIRTRAATPETPTRASAPLPYAVREVGSKDFDIVHVEGKLVGGPTGESMEVEIG